MSTTTPGWVPDDRPALDVRPNREYGQWTFFEAGSKGVDRMCRWITVDAAGIVGVEECR